MSDKGLFTHRSTSLDEGYHVTIKTQVYNVSVFKSTYTRTTPRIVSDKLHTSSSSYLRTSLAAALSRLSNERWIAGICCGCRLYSIDNLHIAPTTSQVSTQC